MDLPLTWCLFSAERGLYWFFKYIKKGNRKSKQEVNFGGWGGEDYVLVFLINMMRMIMRVNTIFYWDPQKPHGNSSSSVTNIYLTMSLTIKNVHEYLKCLSMGISEECSNIKRLRLFNWECQTYPCLLFFLRKFSYLPHLSCPCLSPIATPRTPYLSSAIQFSSLPHPSSLVWLHFMHFPSLAF